MTGGTFLYVSQHGSGDISVLHMNAETGNLTSIQTVAVGGKVMPMAISPDRRFLYAALRNPPAWSTLSFAIDAHSGKLTRIGETPGHESAVYLSTDRTGRHLLAALNPHHAHRTGILRINAIGDQGCAQAPYEIFRTPPKMHAVIPDPSNRFLIGTSCDGDVILRYAFDATTGIVNPDPLSSVMVEQRRGPRHLVFHPNNRFLYLVNEYDASIYAFRYDVRSGALTEVQIANAQPPGYTPAQRRDIGISAAAADIHFTPDGRWLYVSVRGSCTMAVFAVDPATGHMTPGGHFAMPKEPRGFAIDPTGRYLFCAGDGSSKLVAFAIDPKSGDLSQRAEYVTGDGPNWVECIRL